MSAVQLEICVESIDSVKHAIEGGADRVELCAALIDGGLTPSHGLIGQAMQTVSAHYPEQLSGGIHVLIRPRGGDFCYNTEEMQIMQWDIQDCLELASHFQPNPLRGVVVGSLLPDGSIDEAFVTQVVEMTKDRQINVTFHRAFDVASGNPVENLKLLDKLGVHYLLTSGCSPSVGTEDGRKVLRALTDATQEFGLKIKVIAGGGVNAENIAQIKSECNLTQFHGSARSFKTGRMTYRTKGIFMGGERKNDDSELVEYGWKSTDAEIVKKFKSELQENEMKKV
jgi:copper homeostasis protein